MIVWLSSWVLFFELCVKEILHHYYCISLLSQPFHCILSPFSLSSLPVNVIMLRVCRQKDRVHPAVQRLKHTWAMSPMLDCKQGFCKHFNPANLHRPSLTGMAAASKYCMVLAYNQRKTFMHASWLVNKSVNCLVIGQWLPCRHLPFVNRKCHTLAPPPTVTTHNPQTLGNAW